MILSPRLDPETVRRLNPAVIGGASDWHDVADRLANGEMMLWHHDGMTISTEVDEDGYCDVRLGGGVMKPQTLAKFEAAVREYHANDNVHTLRIWGRRGWERMLPHWRKTGTEDGLVVLELAL